MVNELSFSTVCSYLSFIYVWICVWNVSTYIFYNGSSCMTRRTLKEILNLEWRQIGCSLLCFIPFPSFLSWWNFFVLMTSLHKLKSICFMYTLHRLKYSYIQAFENKWLSLFYLSTTLKNSNRYICTPLILSESGRFFGLPLLSKWVGYW